MKFEIERLEKITLEALQSAYTSHFNLGLGGAKEIGENQFGNKVLKADWEAEEFVIKTLEKYGVPIKIISEEHGTIELGREFLGIIDGLDGSNRYLAFMNGDKSARYGTMFAVFEGVDPNYKDYLTSNILEYPTGRLFSASRGNGGFVLDIDKNLKSPIKVSDCKVFDNTTKILIDHYEKSAHYNFITRTYVDKLPKDFNFNCLLSSAAHYADFSSGKIDLVLECTRKGNLEIAVAYGLAKESKGCMYTIDGIDIGSKNYLGFAQSEYVPIISASTPQLVLSFLEKTRLKQ